MLAGGWGGDVEGGAGGVKERELDVAAIAAVKDWFENRTDESQVFRLFGYAGTGKSGNHRPSSLHAVRYSTYPVDSMEDETPTMDGVNVPPGFVPKD